MKFFVRYTGTDWSYPRGKWFTEFCEEDYPEIKFRVSSFENGIAIIEELSNKMYSHEYVFEFFTKCMNKESCFEEELKKAFGCVEDDLIELKAICYKEDNISVTITNDYCDSRRVKRKWEAATERIHGRYREDAFDGYSENEFGTFSFKNKEAMQIWKDWVSDYTFEGYTHSIVEFTECWAKYIQKFMARHNCDISKAILFAPHVNKENRHIFYNDAIYMLAECWYYADELSEILEEKPED